MGSYQYNAAAFAQAISNATRLVSEASAAQSSINSALDSLNPPEDLDIRGMISTIKAKVNEFVQKAKEIRSQVESIRSQIESTDAALASQVNSLVERNGVDTIKAASDLPFKERLKNLIKGAGTTISATAKTALESIGSGMLKTGAKVVSGVVSNVAEAIDKVNFDILKNDTFMGKTRKEYYNDVEKNLKNIKYFTETPEYTYKDGAGVERYKSLYSHGNNSAIDLDGKTANTITSFSEMLSNIALVSTGAGGVALSAFGRGGEGVNQALDEGYHVDSSLLNYGTLKTGAGVVEAAIDKYVINNIPEVKGLGGKLENIAIAGLSNAPETFVNSILQKATYKADKDFIDVFNENGGLKQAGIDALTGAAFTAGGETISGIVNKFIARNSNENITDTINFNPEELEELLEEYKNKLSDLIYGYNDKDLSNVNSTQNKFIDINSNKNITDTINLNSEKLDGLLEGYKNKLSDLMSEYNDKVVSNVNSTQNKFYETLPNSTKEKINNLFFGLDADIKNRKIDLIPQKIDEISEFIDKYSYKSYDSYNDFVSDYKPIREQWEKSLDTKETSIIRNYIGEGFDSSYKTMNGFLRGSLVDPQKGEIHIKAQTYSFDEYEKLLKSNGRDETIQDFLNRTYDECVTLDNAVRKMTLKENTTLYRGTRYTLLKQFGIDENSTIDQIRKNLVGKEYVDLGFMSSSPVPDGGFTDWKDVNLVMNCKKGTPFADFSTFNSSEQEVLLTPGQKFDIADVYEKTGKIFLVLNSK